ncbi:MAG: AmmeMemoRadiSam system protein B [Candidatus Omnitrophica bacterium]|nr:AmmeMemoRadiSam system protein B [Candidatus Omnitrophota bacterium]MDE2221548.1 AmmeMemoRadiSam system protein B [Candidatus Omnitrophota bacterium]
MKRIIFWASALLLWAVPSWSAMVKEPNVAGAFYSADPKELSDDIDRLLRSASSAPTDRRVQIAVAPHAGYPYSGPVAAYTYKAVSRNHYSTIVVIGPSHFFPFEGISVWPEGGFKTPLGVVGVDDVFAKNLLKENPKEFHFLPHVFEREHSVEVQLPFLQKTFKNFRIVPILMGDPDPKVCKDLALALIKLIGERQDVLILISSDMSHYYTYDEANRMDALTLQTILNGDIEKFFEGNLTRKMEMCGFVPMTTAMMYAKLRGIKHVQVLMHANSGDTSGDKSRVVGYGSLIFYTDLLGAGDPPDAGIASLSQGQKQELLKIARDTVEKYVRTGKVPDFSVNDPRLEKAEGAFVTLTKHGELRGCIGNIIGRQPLYKTVRDMAVAAASQDPRFTPVTAAELKDIHIEISVLSEPRRVRDASQIQLGKDGVIVSRGGRQGVFLPQVAQETGWSKEEFLSQLCAQKAGLPPDAWKDPATALFVFTADVFAEK